MPDESNAPPSGPEGSAPGGPAIGEAGGSAGADPGEAAGAGPGGAAVGAPLTLIAQYVKDLSFENPRAPDSIAQMKEPPKVSLNIEVRSRNWRDNTYEVVLYLKLETASAGETLFITELAYAGLFALSNVPEAAIPLVLHVQCPQLLFPFARRVLSDAVRDGGFPPFNLSPIDFLHLYQRRGQREGKGAGTA